MHVGNKRVDSANGRFVDRAHTKHELGGHLQSADHHSSFDVFRQRGITKKMLIFVVVVVESKCIL